ncbi:MAG: dihydroorotate dehydrogenase electron transfer subunit [Clostridia bacterium]|nr:dihydroorotate dehydrogenase electron transfer subunit [Clostridia bacterium]
MMKQGYFTIASNDKIAENVYKMQLLGDASSIVNAGEFINIKLDGLYLRRPISVYDATPKSVTIIYKVVGKGTEVMSSMKDGVLDVLTGLGNGYDLSLSGDKPLLIGGGVGVPPLYLLCKKLISENKKPTVILGFNTSSEIILEKDFLDLGVDVIVTTVDGSYGVKGFVTNALDGLDYTYVYTCGPLPMLKAVYNATKTSGEYSFEERMGCGFGACMGCSCKTLYGNKRICKDGPVLKKEEIIWEK